MKESVLKKEFNPSDVNRLRNIISGDGKGSTKTLVGYTKKHEKRKEGDTWEENGKMWVIKKGLKQNVTKLDKAKSLIITPIFCPSCNKPMVKRFDKDYFRIHKKCFDCVVEFETKLRKLKLYKEYQTRIHNSEIDFFIKDFKSWIEQKVQEAKTNDFITESGDIENWIGNINQSKILEELNKTIEYLENLKK